MKTVGISEANCKLPYYSTFIARDIKDRLSSCLLDFPSLVTDTSLQVTTQFSTLDNKNIAVSPAMLRPLIGEATFNPQLIFQDMDDSIVSIQEAIVQVINNCAIDTRKTLLSNIFLSGGATMVPGFHKRLQKELMNLMSSQQKSIDVRADPYRKHAAWIGGNTLSLCDPFQDMWHLKEEYDEWGFDGL